MDSNRILILDYGSQFTQLIARRIREERVYCEIQPPTRTVGWIREAWPVKLPGTETWIVYCMARPESGELSASVFLIF